MIPRPVYTVVINHVILSDYRSCNCISKFLVFGLCFSFKNGMSKMSSWFSNLVKNFLEIWSNFLGEFDLKIWWKTKSRNHDQDILKIKSIYNSEMVCLKCLVDLQIWSNFLGEFDLQIWWKTKSRNHDQDILKITSIYNSEMVTYISIKCINIDRMLIWVTFF